MLADASRVLAVASILIASRNEGKIPLDEEYMKRVAYLSSVDFKPLIDIGFLERASKCTQLRTNALPELETEYKESTPDGVSIWDIGTQLLGSRSYVGKLIKLHGEEAVGNALAQTSRKNPADPKQYIAGILRAESNEAQFEGAL